MSSNSDKLEQVLNVGLISETLRKFASDRDWDKFHSPKNLAMALNVEAAELLEHFQWLTEEQSRTMEADKLEAVGTEIADVLVYLIRLSDLLNINLSDAVESKMKLNAQKYPVDKVYGSSKKYTEYE